MFQALHLSIDTLRLIAFVRGQTPMQSESPSTFPPALITPTYQLPLVDIPVLMCSSSLQTCFNVLFREPD